MRRAFPASSREAIRLSSAFANNLDSSRLSNFTYRPRTVQNGSVLISIPDLSDFSEQYATLLIPKLESRGGRLLERPINVQ
jgi:hypothetical protein